MRSLVPRDHGNFAMRHAPSGQIGGSSIFNAILLLALAYGIFFGIQYIPQKIESTTVDSILESLSSSQQSEPATDVQSVEAAINRLLNVNQMDELRSNFHVRQSGYDFIVEVSYDRTINLIYEEKTVHYERAITLESRKTH